MANMYCKGQKANSDDFRGNFDHIFRRRIVHPKDCSARITIKKEDLPKAVRDHFYPEEKRKQEIDRVMKQSKKEECHGTDDDRHRSDRLPAEENLPEAEEKEEAQA